MLPYNVIKEPGYAAALDRLGPERDRPLLVVWHGEAADRDLLLRVLAAAGYQDVENELHLLEWPEEDGLHLTGLARELAVARVILFGYALPDLGLHLRLAPCVPVEVNKLTLLHAPALATIGAAKQAGDNGPAAALWGGIKEGFLKPT